MWSIVVHYLYGSIGWINSVSFLRFGVEERGCTVVQGNMVLWYMVAEVGGGFPLPLRLQLWLMKNESAIADVQSKGPFNWAHPAFENPGCSLLCRIVVIFLSHSLVEW